MYDDLLALLYILGAKGQCEIRGKSFSVDSASRREKAAEVADAEQSKRRDHGGEGSRKCTAGLFCAAK